VDSIGLSSFNFFLWALNCIFSARVRICHSRLSKVIDFDTSRKCVCDFLLLRLSNFGLSCLVSDILQVFCLETDLHAYSTLILRGIPIGPDHCCWGQSEQEP